MELTKRRDNKKFPLLGVAVMTLAYFPSACQFMRGVNEFLAVSRIRSRERRCLACFRNGPKAHACKETTHVFYSTGELHGSGEHTFLLGVTLSVTFLPCWTITDVECKHARTVSSTQAGFSSGTIWSHSASASHGKLCQSSFMSEAESPRRWRCVSPVLSIPPRSCG